MIDRLEVAMLRFVVAMLTLAACGAPATTPDAAMDGDRDSGCVPMVQILCACPDGRQSFMECGSSGAGFGPCLCGSDAGRDAADADAAVDSGCLPTGPEICDGLDNDCNGAVDDVSTPEICNGADDNCDGLIDNLPPTPCDYAHFPVGTPCRAGLIWCENGRPSACRAPPPMAEVCNGIDDDCDGVVDNGAPCTSPEQCVNGGCR